ncbi:MAG: hypothetical protein WKF78_10215 [Candidatus Limnocylindrales bacterium]
MSWGRFDTRTIVLIPIAIAINIVLGQTVGAALKIPIYLDSIGTILVGVLAGPIPGLVTGLLARSHLDVRPAGPAAVALCRAVRRRRGGDRVRIRPVRPVRLLPLPPELDRARTDHRRRRRPRHRRRAGALHRQPLLHRRVHVLQSGR